MGARQYDWVAEAFFGPAAVGGAGEGGAGTETSGPAGAGTAALDFVAFDLETTGLEAGRDRIAEIGAVRFERRGVVGRFSTLVNPGIPMPKEASAVNGITDDMLAGAPGIDQALDDFLRFAEGAILVAHNAPFDCGFVNSELGRLDAAARARKESAGQGSLLDLDGGSDGTGAPTGEAPEESTARWEPPYAALPHRVVDTLAFAKEAMPGLRRYSLQELAKYLGIQALDAHRAEDDARVCMELFVKCAELGEPRRA